MARDRKRAKQRRVRRGASAARGTTAAGAVGEGAARRPAAGQPAEQGLVRADLPGALEHGSAEVDEFDAALVRGAGGVTATPDTGIQEDQADTVEDGLEPPSSASGDGGGDAGGGDGDRGGGGGDRGQSGAAPQRGGNRAIGFLRASWAELQRVQWPDRRQVTQATAVVLGFVALAGAYLGLADYVAKEIVEFIL